LGLRCAVPQGNDGRLEADSSLLGRACPLLRSGSAVLRAYSGSGSGSGTFLCGCRPLLSFCRTFLSPRSCFGCFRRSQGALLDGHRSGLCPRGSLLGTRRSVGRFCRAGLNGGGALLRFDGVLGGSRGCFDGRGRCCRALLSGERPLLGLDGVFLSAR